MEYIEFNKMSKKMSMYNVLKIYQTIIINFYDEFLKKKKELESENDNLFQIMVSYSYNNGVRLTYDLNLDRVIKTNAYSTDSNLLYAKVIKNLINKKVENHESFFDEKKLDELMAFCNDFFNKVRNDLPCVSVGDKSDFFYLTTSDKEQFFPINKLDVIEYSYGNKGSNITYVIKITPNGVKIQGDDIFSILENKSPILNYNKLPSFVREYIEKNKENKTLFTCNIPIISTIGEQLQKYDEPIIIPPKKANIITEREEILREKEKILRELEELDRRDDKYNEEQLIHPRPIPEYVFFSSITEEKKEVDPFFRANSGALKYCNLSYINFDKADIRGLDLSWNKEANIDLNTIYNRDITGTNLKNNQSLSGKSLKGIIADGANLMGTFVKVPIDFTLGINNTIFDTTCRFLIGLQEVEHESLRRAGYIINNVDLVNNNMHRDEAIISQEIAYRDGLPFDGVIKRKTV